MKPDLSIIIPCYNCAQTLEEAVASCFTQGLDAIGKKFEIVMVDDGSTDNTRQVMEKMEQEYGAKEGAAVRLFFHEKNAGGGAARNTAVKNARAEIIFCLDSDDMLAENTLAKMLTLMLEKKTAGTPCDGVGIHISKKFSGTDITKIHVVHTFGYAGEIVPFESLFQKDDVYCPLYSTFMHTKEAFAVMGGYPTDHGFDTQAFAWRFLMNGLTAYTCPDAVYLHRVNFNKSYYIREYESGKANYNWSLIFGEFLYVFSTTLKDLILGFDLHSDKNLYEEIRKEPNPLCDGYADYVRKDSKKYKADEIAAASADMVTKYDAYWLAREKAYAKNYPESLHYFLLAYQKGLRAPEQFRKIMAAVAAKIYPQTDPVHIVGAIMTQEGFKKRGSSASFASRAFRKALKIAKKNKVLYAVGLRILWLSQGIKNRGSEKKRRQKYYAAIEKIKKDKKIVVDLQHGGIGDCLAWSTLPRLLAEKYGVEFYLSEQSLHLLRHKDIFKLCFELNPFFKGVSNDGPFFSYDSFESEKSLYTSLTDRGGKTMLETLERQFGVSGDGKGVRGGKPELYYKPRTIDGYKHTILIDKNMISGKKFGWTYAQNIFEKEASRHQAPGDTIEYVDTSKQDLFGYVDMIYSCNYFVCTFSGGASVAACFDKPFSVIWPKNGKNGSNYQFAYTKSRGNYVSR